MYNHDYDFLWGTCSYIHRTKCWKEVLLLFTPRFLFVSQFPLSNHFILYSWLLLFFVQNRCGFVCRSMLAAGGCWHRCVGCRSGWVVAVWDLIQSETKGDIYLATPAIVSSTMMREDHVITLIMMSVDVPTVSTAITLTAHSLKKDGVFLEDKFNILSREDLWLSHCWAALQLVSHAYLSIY